MFSHPLFYEIARFHAVRGVRAAGHADRARDASELCTPLFVDTVQSDSPLAASTEPMPVGKLGDGTIIQAIIDFFKSPQGQALIAALIKALLAMLIGA